MIWKLDPVLDTYLCGEENHGCGVYEENDRWYANISCYGTINSSGPYVTMESAMNWAEKELGRLEKLFE